MSEKPKTLRELENEYFFNKGVCSALEAFLKEVTKKDKTQEAIVSDFINTIKRHHTNMENLKEDIGKLNEDDKENLNKDNKNIISDVEKALKEREAEKEVNVVKDTGTKGV